MISEHYRELNRALHATGTYGTDGDRWATVADALATKYEAATILDYGCGTGSLKRMLDSRTHSYEVLEYDPAIVGKEARPDPADFVVCGDVLEHIEPEFLEDVLDDLQRVARKAIFMVISTVPAKKSLADGRNAHLIVKPVSWWLPKIMDRWELQVFRNESNGFICTGTAQ